MNTIDTQCEVCGGKKFKFFSRKNSHNIYRCQMCDLMFVYPLPDTASLYEADYFTGGEKGFGYVDYDKDKAVMDDVLHKYLDHIEQAAPRKGKIFDVGAATGYFLDIARSRGWEVAGLEVSDHAAQVARNKNINVVTSTLDSAPFPPASFEAVAMWDVIEHLSNPRASIRKVNELLKPGGVFAINAPDAGSLVAKLMGKHWHLIFPPEHLFYFNKKNISRLLKDEGFKVLHAGSMRKRFTLRYALRTLYHTQPKGALKFLAGLTSNKTLGNIQVPSLKDNLFIIAQKD